MSLRWGDWVVFLLTALVISLFATGVYSRESSVPVVTVESEGKTWVYPISEDRIVGFEGPLGKTLVEIQDDLVRFKDSPCPHNICMIRGWMEHPGEFTACLPNRVMVSIEGQ